MEHIEFLITCLNFGLQCNSSRAMAYVSGYSAIVLVFYTFTILEEDHFSLSRVVIWGEGRHSGVW